MVGILINNAIKITIMRLVMPKQLKVNPVLFYINIIALEYEYTVIKDQPHIKLTKLIAANYTLN